jgi:subtilisin-like proprotein convertase family protein
VLAALGAALLCLGTAPVADAQKKKKKPAPRVFTASQSPNASVPDAPPAAQPTKVQRTIVVPKKFKGRVVGDVNVTGIRTTGSAAAAARDLTFVLTAPDGTTVQLFQNWGDQSLGPWTLDDDTATSMCDSATPTCEDPDATLVEPFAGTSNLLFLENGDTGPLSSFDGGRMNGNWTLGVFDDGGAGVTSVWNSWGLKITAAKPITKPKKKKKGKKPRGVFNGSANPNAAVPEDAAAGPSTAISSTINVGKAFKGRVVGDLDLTGLRVTGPDNAADDLVFKLRAPNGRTVQVLSNKGDTGIGPLTLNDETRTSICDESAPTCVDPDQSLVQPFAGTANVLGAGVGGVGPLSSFDGVPMRGNWTLTAVDEGEAAGANTLNSWGLRIAAAKPVKAAKKGTKPFSRQLSSPQAIPDAPAAGPATAITQAVTIPKKFKGLSVGDLDVTGLRTTGAEPDAANDLSFKLQSPSGTTVRILFQRGDQSIGPLTLSDDTATSLCDDTVFCNEAYQDLLQPFAGTANLLFNRAAGTGPLSSFDGEPMSGRWTLSVVDTDATQTSTLESWGIKVTPAKPVPK